ncbi:MAG: helix-turn-helix domain-containing protein [Azovibrio sp.]
MSLVASSPWSKINGKNTVKKSNLEDWHPADIVAALHKRSYTLRDIVREHGLKTIPCFERQ